MIIYTSTELYHHGIKGQKWGVRRFQNEDGSLTAKGEKRYQIDTFQKSGRKVLGRQGKNRLYKDYVSQNKDKNAFVRAADKFAGYNSSTKKVVFKTIGATLGTVAAGTAITTAASILALKARGGGHMSIPNLGIFMGAAVGAVGTTAVVRNIAKNAGGIKDSDKEKVKQFQRSLNK